MHKKVIEYKILSSHAEQVSKIQQLEKIVNEYILEGWQPKGCLVIDHEGTLHQVVVKFEQVV
jgi:hypothetical protein